MSRYWSVSWHRHGPDMPANHGRVEYATKKQAIAVAMESDNCHQYAHVHHPKTHEIVAAFGNFNCYDKSTWDTWKGEPKP